MSSWYVYYIVLDNVGFSLLEPSYTWSSLRITGVVSWSMEDWSWDDEIWSPGQSEADCLKIFQSCWVRDESDSDWIKKNTEIIGGV